MASIRDYFDRDFTRDLNISHAWTVHTPVGPLETPARLHLDFDSGTTYASFFVPSTARAADVARSLLSETATLVSEVGLEVQRALPGETPISSKDLLFAGTVFLYLQDELQEDELQHLIAVARGSNLRLRVRGPRFAEERSKFERPLAFISHDSRDKDVVARPIAVGLQKLMRPVWFDEFSLKVGDPLRESIERGLKESRKCILVLSPHFLANTGWTKIEFNSVFTREVVERQKVVLPVWHGVTREEVYEYSPSLADRVGLLWSLGADEVVRRLSRALEDPGSG